MIKSIPLKGAIQVKMPLLGDQEKYWYFCKG